MTDAAISPDLRAFILRYLDSIAHLECLILIRAAPEDVWSAAAMAQRLYISERQADDVLGRLSDDGLISRRDDGFLYGEHDEQMARLIDELADTHARHLIPVTNLIHGKPRRIREFADAFKFKKGR